jgi:hypothetical protein
MLSGYPTTLSVIKEIYGSNNLVGIRFLRLPGLASIRRLKNTSIRTGDPTRCGRQKEPCVKHLLTNESIPNDQATS